PQTRRISASYGAIAAAYLWIVVHDPGGLGDSCRTDRCTHKRVSPPTKDGLYSRRAPKTRSPSVGSAVSTGRASWAEHGERPSQDYPQSHTDTPSKVAVPNGYDRAPRTDLIGAEKSAGAARAAHATSGSLAQN